MLSLIVTSIDISLSTIGILFLYLVEVCPHWSFKKKMSKIKEDTSIIGWIVFPQKSLWWGPDPPVLQNLTFFCLEAGLLPMYFVKLRSYWSNNSL